MMSYSLEIVFIGSTLLLTFFTFLIRRLQKANHPSAPELMGRTVTFWGMLILFLIAMTTPSWVTYILIDLACCFALYEYSTFQSKALKPVSSVPSYLFIVCQILVPLNLAFHYFYLPFLFLSIVPLFLAVILPGLFVLQNKPGQFLVNYGFVASGVLFFVYAFSFAAGLLHFSQMCLVLCFLLTEIRDLVSYWVGKISAKFERGYPQNKFWKLLNHKIASQVSPNKSWGVGIISTLLLIVLAVLCRPLLQSESQAHISHTFMIFWAVLIGLFGLLGDLVFSLMKREFGLKDSGSTLPGQTGIIDRIDSLVLTIPMTYFYFQWMLGGF